MKKLLTTLTALLVFGNVSAGDFDMKCETVKKVRNDYILRCENIEVVCYYAFAIVGTDGGSDMQCKFKKGEK